MAAGRGPEANYTDVAGRSRDWRVKFTPLPPFPSPPSILLLGLLWGLLK